MNDSNLKIVEDRFNASITVRGENIFIKGVIEEVEGIEKIFKEMTYVLNTSGKLTEDDIVTILNLTIEGKEVIDEQEYDSIVLYTKHDVVKARTSGQKKYVEAATNNDICFAIGPAGTGKTYLAVALAISSLKKGLVKRIILARPAVEAGESLGFLPGDFRDSKGVRMLVIFHRAGFVLTALSLVAPAHAGMKSDLANCPAGLGAKSAKACTRILKSGRLPKKQFYIAYYNRGWSYRNAGDYKRAQRDFDKVVKLKRRFAEGYYSRAVVHYDRGKASESIKDLDRYVNYKKQKKWAAYYGRALMLRRLKQRSRALSDLRTAEKLEPTEQKIAVMRALILSDQGNHTEAMSAVAQVISAHPNDADALHARAVIQFRRQRFDEADADLEEAIKTRASFEAAYLLRGRISERRGKYEHAREHYERAVAFSARTVEQLYAQKAARERLWVLNGRANQPVVTSSIVSDCRRFVPSANMTIAVKCADGRANQPVVTSSIVSSCRRFVPAANMTIAVECAK